MRGVGEGRSTRVTRWLARGTLVGIAGFCGAMIVAMLLYPGGTWLRPSASTHEFWANFWCDLLRDQAHNGRPNAGRPWAQFGMLSLAAGTSAFWGTIAACVRRGPLVIPMVVLGGLASLGMVVVITFPSDRFPAMHRLAITFAGPFGIAATCLAVALFFVERRRQGKWLARLGVITVAGALVNLAQFVRQMWLGSSESIVLSAAQKVTTLLLLLWMASVAWVAVGWSDRSRRNERESTGGSAG